MLNLLDRNQHYVSQTDTQIRTKLLHNRLIAASCGPSSTLARSSKGISDEGAIGPDDPEL